MNYGFYYRVISPHQMETFKSIERRKTPNRLCHFSFSSAKLAPFRCSTWPVSRVTENLRAVVRFWLSSSSLQTEHSSTTTPINSGWGFARGCAVAAVRWLCADQTVYFVDAPRRTRVCFFVLVFIFASPTTTALLLMIRLQRFRQQTTNWASADDHLALRLQWRLMVAPWHWL